MPIFDEFAGIWFLRSAMGGGIVLLGGWLIIQCFRQPARQQRLAECTVAAALVLPALCWIQPWLVINWPKPQNQALMQPEKVAELDPSPNSQAREPDQPNNYGVSDNSSLIASNSPSSWRAIPWDAEDRTLLLPSPDNAQTGLSPQAEPEANHGPQSQPANSSTETLPSFPWNEQLSKIPWESVLSWSLGIYALGVVFFLIRWLGGQWALARLLRRARPAPWALKRRLETLSGERTALPRLLISDALAVPMSCGIFRPTIVLPGVLAETASPMILDWVLAHEWVHLDRRDAWSGLLFNVAQTIYFFVPWYWWLRRRMGLCQEFLADARASSLEARADYAQFLVGLIRSPAVPLGATGVSGYSSDLYRRVAMLVGNREKLESRCPRLWSAAMATGLLGLAASLAGVGWRAEAATADQTSISKDQEKNEPKKDEPKKEGDAKDGDAAKHLSEVQKHFLEVQREQQKAMEKMRAEMQKLQAEMAKEFGQMPNFQMPNIPMPNINFQGMGGLAGMPEGMGFGMGGGAGFGFGRQPQDGRLGVRVQKPSEALADQLDLPKGQGLIVEQVMPESAAAKAGIKPHDILLEVAGKTVPDNPNDLSQKVLHDIKPDTKVDVVVLRKGKKETIKGVALPEAKTKETRGVFANPGFPGAANNVFPNVPNPPGGVVGRLVPNNFPGQIAIGANAAGGVMTTTFRNNDRFTTRHQEGSLIITVTGKIDDGKAKTEEIHVQDGNTTTKYESVDKVPEQYRDKVKNLVEMSEKGSVKVEVKP